MEPFPEERENFLQQLYKFMEDRGEPPRTFALFHPLVQVQRWLLPSFPGVAFAPVGTPINKRPVLGYRNLNLFKLYRLVHKLGGFDNVSDLLSGRLAAAAPLSLSVLTGAAVSWEQIESGSVWKQVYQDLGIPILNSAAGYNVKCAYRK